MRSSRPQLTLAFHDVVRNLQGSPIFAFYALATLVVAGIIGLITFDVIDLGMTHFGEPSHRAHDVTYGLLFATLVVGVAAQLRRPAEQVAGMVMALLPVAALLVAGVLADDIDAVVRSNPLRYAAAVTAIAALVHPAGRTGLRSFSIARASSPLVALVAVATVPLLLFASSNIERQRTVADAHELMGHYGFMAAFSFTVIAVALLASLSLDGWRVPAWVAGLLPVIVGTTSLLSPDAASSLQPPWALAAVAWGAVFVSTAEATKRVGTASFSSERPSRGKSLVDAQ